MEENLAQLRAQLDALDDALAELLARRAALSLRVGELKRRTGSAVHQPEREAAVLARLCSLSAAKNSPLSPAQLQNIYREIFAVSRQLQENR